MPRLWVDAFVSCHGTFGFGRSSWVEPYGAFIVFGGFSICDPFLYRSSFRSWPSISPENIYSKNIIPGFDGVVVGGVVGKAACRLVVFIRFSKMTLRAKRRNLPGSTIGAKQIPSPHLQIQFSIQPFTKSSA